MIWLLFICGILISTYTLFSFYVGYRSPHWPYIPGKIKHSNVVVRTNKASSSKNKYYHPNIIYEYEIGTKKYTNNKIGNYIGFDTNEEYAKDIVKNYPENGEAQIYYCPFYRGLSILNPGMKQKTAHVILLFTGIFIILGTFPVLFTENPTWLIDKIFGFVDYIT